MKLFIALALLIAPLASQASSRATDGVIQRLHDAADDVEHYQEPTDHRIYEQKLVRQTELTKNYEKELRRQFSHAHGDEKQELGGEIRDVKEALERWGADRDDKQTAREYVYRRSSALQ